MKKFDVFLTTVFFCDVSSIKSQYILLFRTILSSEYIQDDNVLPMFLSLHPTFVTEDWWDHKATNNANLNRFPVHYSLIGANNLLEQNPGY